jgi:diguanylate cyclase (GGDEF)-like protein
VASARRFGSAVAVAYIDVSGLKAVNDQHGHAAGDALLRTVAEALRTGARGSDIVARLGGDEFAALLLGTDVPGARVYLERVRGAAQYVELPGGGAAPVRLSAGVATRDEAGSLTAALEIADQRLLLDKRQR